MSPFSGGKEQRDILEEGPRGRPTMVIRDDKSQAQQRVSLLRRSLSPAPHAPGNGGGGRVCA